MFQLAGIMLKILVFSNYYLPGFKGGGPIKTLKNLFDYTGDKFRFELVTSDRDLGDQVPYHSVDVGDWNKLGNSWIFYSPSGWKGYKCILHVLFGGDIQIVYLNSFFSIRYSFFPLLISRLLGKRIVLGPRGEFSEGALKIRTARKRVFISVSKLFGLHTGIVFQASSNFEEQDIRRVMGPYVSIKVAENIGSREFAKTIPARSERELNAVFVSRISPKKNLLSALGMLSSVSRPVRYDIYGPIEDKEYWGRCLEVIKALPEHVKVTHKGMLSPDEVVPTLAEYDVFFFPTKGENYGHVIAEALCAGLPILIANTTPWRDLDEIGIGWDLPLDNAEAFSATLDRLAAMSIDEHLQMRKTVLAWAKNKFSQRDAIEANIAMFRYAYEN